MVNYCVVSGCKTEYNPIKRVSFHTFPFKRPELLKLWLQAIKRDNWYPSKTSRICGQHFLTNDFQIKPGCLAKCLKPDAVPSVFKFRKEPVLKKVGSIEGQSVEQRVEVWEIKVEPEPLVTDTANDIEAILPSTPQQSFVSKSLVDKEVQTPAVNPSNLVNKETQTPAPRVDNQTEVLRRKVKTLNQKLRRKDLKISKMKEIIKQLSESC